MIGTLPTWNSLNWRGNSCQLDGHDVGIDLTNSYADAGDTVVFAFPLVYSLTMVAWTGVEYQSTYVQLGEWNRYKQILKWGTDWIIKAHSAPNVFWGQIASGELDHAVWVTAEFVLNRRESFQINATHPGSDLAAEAAATLAAAAIVFKVDNPTYSNLCIQHAKQLFKFATTYRGIYSKSIPDAAGFYSSNGYEDELLWAALWLWKATSSIEYKSFAIDQSRVLVEKTLTWSLVWDDKSNGVSYLLCQEFKDAAACRQTEGFLDYWAKTIRKTAGGLAYLSSWGSLRYPHSIGYIGLTYIKRGLTADATKIQRWSTFAKSQMDYTLGTNPLNLSYVVGYGTKWPQQVHNRRTHGSCTNDMFSPKVDAHIGYMVVGGPDDRDQYDDTRTNYVHGEYANDMGCAFMANAIALTARYGGTPRANFPPTEPIGPEFNIRGVIAQYSSKAVQLNTKLSVCTNWPPRHVEVIFRIYLNLSHVFSQGMRADDVYVNSYYNEGAMISPLTLWNKCVYYIEVKYVRGLIYPQSTTTSNKQTQLTMRLAYDSSPTTWNSDWDWWRDNTRATRVNTISEVDMLHVPIYEVDAAGTRILKWGSEPPIPNVHDCVAAAAVLV